MTESLLSPTRSSPNPVSLPTPHLCFPIPNSAGSRRSCLGGETKSTVAKCTRQEESLPPLHLERKKIIRSGRIMLCWLTVIYLGASARKGKGRKRFTTPFERPTVLRIFAVGKTTPSSYAARQDNYILKNFYYTRFVSF